MNAKTEIASNPNVALELIKIVMMIHHVQTFAVLPIILANKGCVCLLYVHLENKDVI
jgi:hypothetical protein